MNNKKNKDEKSTSRKVYESKGENRKSFIIKLSYTFFINRVKNEDYSVKEKETKTTKKQSSLSTFKSIESSKNVVGKKLSKLSVV